MLKVNALLGIALTSIAALGMPATGLAQQKPEGVVGAASGSEMRSQAANRALLEALLRRRAQVAQPANGAEANRAALEFLDRRIAEARGPTGK